MSHERERWLPGRPRRPAVGGKQWSTGRVACRCAARQGEAARAKRTTRAGARSDVPALLHRSRRRSVRRSRMGDPRGGRSATSAARWCSSSATSRFRSSGRSRPPTSSSRSISAGRSGTPERERSVKQLIGRVVDTITEWARAQQVLRERRGPAGVQRRPEAHPRVPEGGVQQPGLVQLRLREGAAVLGLLHQLGAGHDGLDPDAGADRGHAVQVRLGHRHQPVADPLVEGAARRRRHGVGPGLVHEGLRRVCRRHQVGRQDAARGEDGDPQRRSSRTSSSSSTARSRKRRRRGRSSTPATTARSPARRTRRCSSRTRTTACASPTTSCARCSTTATWDTHAVRDGAVMDTYKARELMRLIAEGTHVCGDPGHAVRHDDQRVAHLPEHGSHLREQSVLGVHVPQRLGVQPGVDQPDEVRQGRRRVRRRRPTRRRSAR